MISFDDARNMILSTVKPLEATRVSIRHALGRIASETIAADADAVPFPRSAMDGYAVRAEECSHATREHPIALPLAGKVFAEQAESTLAPRTTLAITTGAPLPDGADAVIPYEQIERHGSTIRIFAPVVSGACIFPPGEDIRRGEKLFTSGESLSAGKLALLAFAGMTQLPVFQRPRVAVLCNGQELVDPGVTPGRGQVRNSNAIALIALVTEFDGVPHNRGTAPDDSAILSAMLESASHDSDLLVIVASGGASRGERDLVKGVLKDLGAKFLFEQVAMRPGKPFGFAIWHGKPVCVLPGTPAASFVCFQELVRPTIARLAGRHATNLPVVRARLHGSLHARTESRYFVLARLDLALDGFVVTPLDNQCSALVRTAAEANAIIVVRETSTGGASRMNSGELVEVEVFEWPRGLVGSDTLEQCSQRTAVLGHAF